MKILSFSDVDMALKRICELEVELNNINGEVTLKCNEIKEQVKSLQIILTQNQYH